MSANATALIGKRLREINQNRAQYERINRDKTRIKQDAREELYRWRVKAGYVYIEA